MDEKVQISTNWCLLRGKNISESLVTKICDNEIFDGERPSIDDIVSFEQSIHLKQNEGDDNSNSNKKEECEIFFKIDPNYGLNSLTLVTDCQTLEMFINIHREYYNTYIGEFLDDFDGMRVYRYDIDITNKASHLVIKFIPRVPEVWIYGIQVTLYTIASGQLSDVTSPLHSISLENVKSILSSSNHKLTPKAEQCKSFVENFLQGNLAKQFNKLDRSNEFMNGPPELEYFKAFFNNSNTNHPGSSTILNSDLSNFKKLTLNGNNEDENYSCQLNDLKKYIDKAVLDMENRINMQLQALEKRQNEKLDKIIELMSSLQIQNNI